jgi:hypothetical protein
MSARSYEGIVVNGKIELPLNVQLPENARVVVIVSDDAKSAPGRIYTPRLAHPEQIKAFEMEVEEAPDARI